MRVCGLRSQFRSELQNRVAILLLRFCGVSNLLTAPQPSWKYTTSSTTQVLMLLFMRFPARLIRSATPRGVSPREGASLPTLPVGTPSTYRSYSRIRDANRPVWRVGLGASDSLMTVNSAIGLLMPLQIQVGMCRTATDHIHHLLRYASLYALTSQRADAEATTDP